MLIKRISKKAGYAPGTLIHVGDHEEPIKISVIEYDEGNVSEKEIESVDDIFKYKDSGATAWINISGVHDSYLIQKIGEGFGIHPLVLEDIMNTGQRPKIEEFQEHIYLVFKMVYSSSDDKSVLVEQVSLILGENFVLSFQEAEGDVFGPVRERIRKDKGIIRKRKADYLAYALLDAIVDNYYYVLEDFGEETEGIEEKLITRPGKNTLSKIHHLKRNLIFMRKGVWPLREILNTLSRGESALISENTLAYFRDVYDHVIQVIDTVEAYRDMASGILDIYLSSVSNRMNEVMKVLTIFASIFIPLTFIAGIYGMNFKYMPELDWHWGYFGVLGIMLLVTLVLLIFFRRKKWL